MNMRRYAEHHLNLEQLSIEIKRQLTIATDVLNYHHVLRDDPDYTIIDIGKAYTLSLGSDEAELVRQVYIPATRGRHGDPGEPPDYDQELVTMIRYDQTSEWNTAVSIAEIVALHMAHDAIKGNLMNAAEAEQEMKMAADYKTEDQG